VLDHLAYIIDLSDAKFVSISNIDSYLVSRDTSDKSSCCLSHIFRWCKVFF